MRMNDILKFNVYLNFEKAFFKINFDFLNLLNDLLSKIK